METFPIIIGLAEWTLAAVWVFRWKPFKRALLGFLQSGEEAQRGRFTWDETNTRIAAYALVVFCAVQGRYLIAIGPWHDFP